jgi:hypothetical protein
MFKSLNLQQTIFVAQSYHAGDSDIATNGNTSRFPEEKLRIYA